MFALSTEDQVEAEVITATFLGDIVSSDHA